MQKFVKTLLLPVLAVSACAQTAPPAQDNPMSTWLRTAYMGNRNTIVRTAERMPEEFYDMRPGAQQEVRTFGQQVGHVAFAYCEPVYAGLTDASGTQMIDITLENGQQRRNLRLGLLTLNYAHNNEIYGSMVTYLRIKNIVPPASEPRTGQKK